MQPTTRRRIVLSAVAVLWMGAAAGAQEPPSAPTASPSPAPAADEPAAPPVIADNMSVELDYTLTVDGAVIESTTGQAPLTYVQGHGQLIPGLERQLAGLKAGDSREITVTPEEGYGPVDPEAVVSVPRTQLPPDITPRVGLMLRGTKPDGQRFRATITEVQADTVMLDMNHPYAGKTLHFSVTIVKISPAAVP